MNETKTMRVSRQSRKWEGEKETKKVCTNQTRIQEKRKREKERERERERERESEREREREREGERMREGKKTNLGFQLPVVSSVPAKHLLWDVPSWCCRDNQNKEIPLTFDKQNHFSLPHTQTHTHTILVEIPLYTYSQNGLLVSIDYLLQVSIRGGNW